MRHTGKVSVVSLAIGLLLSPTLAAPPDTAFTYQGQLKQAGVPVNVTCGMAFTLWNDPVAKLVGNQVGPTLTFDGGAGNAPVVGVVNGLFQVELEFGNAAFNGDARWLQIDVCCKSPCRTRLTTLSPRQPIKPTPYATHTRGIFVDDAGQVGIGTNDPQTRLDTGRTRIRNGGSPPTTGAGLEMLYDGTRAQIFAFDRDGGTFPDLVLQPQADGGSVGIGTTNPGSYRLAIKERSSGSGQGLRIVNAAETASFQAWVGTGGAVLDAEGATNLHLRTGGIDRLFIEGSTGNVGIGTNEPGGLLHLEGDENDRLLLRGVNSAPFLHFRREGNGADWILKHDTSRFHFQTENGPGFEVLTLESNGSVGIGTTDPTQPLDVYGDVLVGGGSASFDGSTEVVKIRGRSASWDLGVQNETAASATGFFIGTSSTDEDTFHITRGGSVGIGTSAPQTRLDVIGVVDVAGGGSNIAGGHALIGNVGLSNLVFDGNELQARVGTASSALFINDRGGNVILARIGRVGIGTPDPQAELHVVGDVQVDGVITSGGPGVASKVVDQISLAGSGEGEVVTVAEQTIDCPGGGFVVAMATMSVSGAVGLTDCFCVGLTTAASGITNTLRRTHCIPANANWHVVTVHETISVTAGSTTVRLRVQDAKGFAENIRLTLMYFPTAYGTVDTP